MRSATYMNFLASAVAAQNSAVVFNPFPYGTALTYVGSDASATTYTNSCPSGNPGFQGVPDSYFGTTPTPAPTPKPRMRRQDASASDSLDYTLCEPYTLVQGASTYELHMTDPVPGVWTADLSCNWKGAAMSQADLTCTVTQAGSVADSRALGTVTSVVSKDDIASMDLFQTLAVVSAPNASASASTVASASASKTPGRSGTGAASPTRSGSTSASGSPATQSTGLAAAGPLSTGAVAFIGGAAGIFAAALAL